MLNKRSNKKFSSIVSSVLCVFSAATTFLVTGCGRDESVHQSKLSSEFQKTYGARFDVPLTCAGVSASQALDVVLESARRLSDFCEFQNQRAAAGGYLRCPSGLCQQEYRPGSVAAPTLKFSVNNGTSMGSMFGGFGGSGGSTGSGSGDSVFGKRIYVSMEFNIPLAKNPDELACVNPLNSTVQTSIMNEITKAALAAKNEPCNTL
ncbi:hypothetical protein EBR21_14510 [bacterium]|nr:hypothetical protein [bacterium]